MAKLDEAIRDEGATCICDRCAHYELLRDAADLLREEGEPQKIAALTERASRLEDAAFHFQTCRRCRADGEFGRSTCLDGQMFDAFLRGEARVDSVPLRVVVNGQPVEVQPGSVREVIRQAIEKSGQIGAPIEQWELRTREGETIPHSLEDGWELAGGKLLFLNLGLPASRVDPVSPPPHQDEQTG